MYYASEWDKGIGVIVNNGISRRIAVFDSPTERDAWVSDHNNSETSSPEDVRDAIATLIEKSFDEQDPAEYDYDDDLYDIYESNDFKTPSSWRMTDLVDWYMDTYLPHEIEDADDYDFRK